MDRKLQIPKRYMDLFISLLGYGFVPLLGIVSSILAARVLGPSGRGELAAVQVVPGFLTVFAFWGCGQSVPYYTARSPERVGLIVGSALLLGLAMCLPAILIGAPIQAFVLADFSDPVRSAGYLFLLFPICNVLNAMSWGALQGKKHFLQFNLVRVQPQIIFVLVIISATLLHRPSVFAIIVAYLLLTLLICATTSWLVYWKYCAEVLSVSRETVRDLFKYGTFSAGAFLCSALNQRVDQAFIAAMLSKEDLGIYVTAAAVSFAIAPMASAFGAVLIPRLAPGIVENSCQQLGRLLRWYVVFVFAIVFLIFCLIPILIPLLFGNAFEPAIHIARILIVAGGFLSLSAVLSDIFRGLGNPAVALYAELSALGMTVIGLFASLSRLGIVGAAFTSLVSYLVSCTVLIILLLRLHPKVLNGWLAAYGEDLVVIFRKLRHFRFRHG